MVARRCLGVLAGLSGLLLAQVAGGVVITLDEAYVTPGDVFDLTVNLASEGALVAGVQADIEFPAEVEVLRNRANRPDCRVNPDINKGATSFGFVPCTTLPDCQRVRALVLALDNVDPIADGSTLYSCRVHLRETARSGDYPLPVVKVGAADPAGNELPARGEAGVVTTGDPYINTLLIGSVTVAAGAGADVPVSLPGISSLGALRHELGFEFAAPIVANQAGGPDCTLAVSDVTATFSFLPEGCRAGETCNAVRADLNGGGEIFPGEVPLYRCHIEARAEAVGDYSLGCDAVEGYDRYDGQVFVDCIDGTVSVLAAEATATAIPSTTPSFRPDPTASAMPTPTINPCGSCPRCYPCQIVNGAAICIPAVSGSVSFCDSDDDGCAIVPRPRQIDWLSALALPLACWLLRRRRPRP
jgi:hypothetical protein